MAGNTNGKRTPPRPRIELVSAGASKAEAAAVVAALEEGIAARQVSGYAWGDPPRAR